MNALLKQLGEIGIIPVVVIEEAENAEPLARALLEGGLPTMEITLRTDAAATALARIAESIPTILLGAGTVLSVEQVKTAVTCGAKYIVSPGLNRKVVEYCLSHSICVIPGVATPTEIEGALEMGLDVVKLFPAEALGGTEYLAAVSAPFRRLKFIPTGGIHASNFLQYLQNPRVLACGGSWMVKGDLAENSWVDQVKQRIAQAVGLMLGIRLLPSTNDRGDGKATADRLAVLSRTLHLPISEADVPEKGRTGQHFTLARGSDPCILLGSNFLYRAVGYLSREGIHVKAETEAMKGVPGSGVRLLIEVEGLPVYLVQL
jgi:2-dehydro-3-deoxyphosphogluconate aldolase/(4S)-4-hydroxy-2-oxoglutarate aldolase